MTARKTILIHGATSAEVEASLHEGLTARDLLLVERVWAEHRVRIMAELLQRSVARSVWPESLHWDWGNKAHDIALLSVSAVGIVCDGEWQGLLLTKTAPYVARCGQDRGKPLVYVDYIESAPWNWSLAALAPLQPRFKGVGSVLLREAVQQSFREEFHGRVGLHSLPQAEMFYEHCGMTRVGKDRQKQNLTYFEFTQQQASLFLNGGNT